MIRYIKIACLTVIVAVALVSAAFFSYIQRRLPWLNSDIRMMPSAVR